MKYSYYKGDRGLVYDANGFRIPYALTCDTETGEVETVVVDEDGGFVLDTLIYSVKRRTAWYAAPLKIVPFDGTPNQMLDYFRVEPAKELSQLPRGGFF